GAAGKRRVPAADRNGLCQLQHLAVAVDNWPLGRRVAGQGGEPEACRFKVRFELGDMRALLVPKGRNSDEVESRGPPGLEPLSSEPHRCIEQVDGVLRDFEAPLAGEDVAI